MSRCALNRDAIRTIRTRGRARVTLPGSYVPERLILAPSNNQRAGRTRSAETQYSETAEATHGANSPAYQRPGAESRKRNPGMRS
jgi:hypothetical protein